MDTKCIQNVSVGKDRLGKDSIGKNNIKEIEISKDISTKKSTFVPPSVEEVKEYCLSVGSQVDAEMFVAFYESKGWLVGKNKMKSWKSAIVTWEKRNNQKPKSDNNKFNSFQQRDYSFDELEKKLISNNK